MSDFGKHIAGRSYFHTSLLDSLDAATLAVVGQANTIACVRPNVDYNVVRFDSLDNSIGLLSYPHFFDDACPLLAKSWKVHLSKQQAGRRSYVDSLNPPVLHRKELLLDALHPSRSAFERLTAELESIGCFEDPIRIGFKLQWEQLLRDRGFRLEGHQLLPIGNAQPEDQEFSRPVEIARHLTALSRSNFSAPMQILRRFGYLDGSRSLFDYGCGKGDDLRGLSENGIRAAGWDPYYASSAEIIAAEVVNLGFVINVIEDPAERREALNRAFALARELLVVSTMVATEDPGRTKLFADGVLTSRFTFQKYYTQAELRQYIASTLGEEPISMAPGIFFVFKDREAEQRFQVSRYRSRLRVHALQRPIAPVRAPKVRDRSARPHRQPPPDKYQLHQALLEPLWTQCLELGREPIGSEVRGFDQIEEALGSLKRALRLTLSRNNMAALEQARSQRIDDLEVFLALQQFQKRKPYKHLEPGLQQDVRVFFGDYLSAQENGRRLLLEVARPEVLDESCRLAAERGLGWLEPSHSLQLHSSLIPRLPPQLRVYVACASVLYGEVSEADLVKIHIRSGKVSFMKFDDFLGSPIPRMTERVKINLRTLDFQLFSYGDHYPSPPLYLKSRYINEELPNYAEQLAFDDALRRLGIVDLSGFGPSETEFFEALRTARWTIQGFRIERSSIIPRLDDRCGRYLTYRQLVECGETHASTRVANLPKSPASYTALLELAANILDPVIEYFGGIELTYGFCSQKLSRRIPGRIAPDLDQHAAHEIKRSGAPICARLGAAADFLVRDENMREVAQWIVENLPFDRLYYYGTNRPLHVSFGPESKREAFDMHLLPTGRRVPRPLGNA